MLPDQEHHAIPCAQFLFVTLGDGAQIVRRLRSDLVCASDKTWLQNKNAIPENGHNAIDRRHPNASKAHFLSVVF